MVKLCINCVDGTFRIVNTKIKTMSHAIAVEIAKDLEKNNYKSVSIQ